MKPRPVDERDTQWESTERNFRIVVDNQGRHGSFDIEHAPWDEVVSWARAQVIGGGTFSVAVRAVDNMGRPGLLWVLEDAT